MKKVILSVMALGLLLGTSCRETTEEKTEDAIEAMGEDIEANAEEAGDAIEAGAEEVEAEMNEAGEEVEAEMNEEMKKMQQTITLLTNLFLL